MRCDDLETLVPAFLDDELADAELRDFQVHAADCAACKELVRSERTSLDELRRVLAAPPLPDMVRRRIGLALDREDESVAASVGRARRSWLLPGLSMAAAAAALIVFIVAQQPEHAGEPIAYDAARQHLRKPPVEVQGARVSPWLTENFQPDVPLPRLGNGDPVGARLSHLIGRDAALLYYHVILGGRAHEVQVRIVNAAGLSLEIGDKAVVGGRTLWMAAERGVSVVAYRARDDLGYVFTSADMRPVDLVDLVATSDLVRRIDQSVQTR